ncbi:MAG TPA: dienelactone hydrolase family protein [Polyangia bacterium]|jgi:carboxymethylenebutenolidase
MPRTAVEIATPDGVCPASLFVPNGSGPWPGVLMYMDGIGMRPTLYPIGQRIADAGYVVLLPDLFYRAGAYEAPDAKTLFSDPAVLEAWRKRVAMPTSDKTMSDTRAFLDTLGARPEVRPGKVGVTGYCMGGRFAVMAAGTFPERIAAAAAFHPGGLATDAPDSPHLLASKMGGARGVKIYVAGADQDRNFPEEMKQRLVDALTAAGVEHHVETYAGMRHGWVPSDTPVHSPEGAERHFKALLDLYASTLR